MNSDEGIRYVSLAEYSMLEFRDMDGPIISSDFRHKICPNSDIVFTDPHMD